MAILGIDEVGRGPLAGPLVVGAVILPEADSNGARPGWVAELRDSKKLSAKKREKLSEIILNEALATGLGWVYPRELDEVGISVALKLATRRAVEKVQQRHVRFTQIVIDGKVNFLKETALGKYVSVMPKADDLVKEVSAASIIAKCARDKYMVDLAVKYPGYGFEKNVGYGTAKHMAAIREIGITEEHRRSFEPIRSMVGWDSDGDGMVNIEKNTTKIGGYGEDKVAEYLVRMGQEIVVRNYKTRTYEIDIVSTIGDKIYFTEVKTRRDNSRGGGIYAVDIKKRVQMKFAAESFLAEHGEFVGYNPILAVADVDGVNMDVKNWLEIF